MPSGSISCDSFLILQVCRQHQAEQCSQYIRWKVSHPRRLGQVREVGPQEPNEVQQGQEQGVAFGSEQSQMCIQTGRRTY